MKIQWITAGILTAGAIASAQTVATPEPRREVRIGTGFGLGVGSGTPGLDTFTFMANEFSFDGKPVQNAPYSAESVTESVQTLTDGNRIVHKTSTQVYRDSQGRTRREESLPGSKKMIFINDPVAKVSYVLDPEQKTARKSPVSNISFSTSRSTATGEVHGSQHSQTQTITMQARNGDYVYDRRAKGPDGVESVEHKVGEEAKAAAERFHQAGPVVAGVAAPMVMTYVAAAKNAKVDQLGKRTIEGVECTGERTTVTLEAGVIGNERPISTVSETWTSVDLRTAVETRRSDPRTGETTFKLTNVQRAEPLRSLFEVPADYKLVENSQRAPVTTIFKHEE